MDNSICCSLRLAREKNSKEEISPTLSSKCSPTPLPLHSASLGHLAVFVQTLFENWGLKLVPLHPLACVFDLSNNLHLISESYPSDPWNLARLSPSSSPGNVVQR